MHATAPVPLPNAVENSFHICIVSETYAPEVNGVAFTLARFVYGLRKQGYTVSVIRPRQYAETSRNSAPNSGETVVRGLPLPGYLGITVWLACREGSPTFMETQPSRCRLHSYRGTPGMVRAGDRTTLRYSGPQRISYELPQLFSVLPRRTFTACNPVVSPRVS